MSNPYVGEIRMFAGNFAPYGWMFCDGQLLSIAENEVLFQLIGTTYGGDGVSTYALPDLRSRVPLHQGQGNGLSNRVIGESIGTETVTLAANQMPAHSHTMQASTHTAVATRGPTDQLGASPSTQIYGAGVPAVAMAKNAIATHHGGLPHDNMGPSLAINFIISLYGIFPSQF
jgi:microcystin-dependent protein